MPTVSQTLPKKSGLDTYSPPLLQPDPDPRSSISSPTDMPTDANRQREPGGSGPSEARITEASSTNGSVSAEGQEETRGGQDENPLQHSTDDYLASASTTNTPTPSLYASARSANTELQDESNDVDIQKQILAVLRKMCDKMDGQEHEDNGQPIGRGTGAHPHKDPFKQTFFGVPKQRFNQGQQFNPVNEDYEQIFPEDPYGEEAGPNARVFRVYNEEAAVYDADMIGQCSDSSDVLLVFAGLFSAVLTTFVAQTSQSLNTDTGAISNSLLSEVVHLLRAQEDGTSFGEVEPAITETFPSRNDLWFNGLWFTSLTLSLATALFAVLTKQWLRQYMRRTSGTARDRSITRQFRRVRKMSIQRTRGWRKL